MALRCSTPAVNDRSVDDVIARVKQIVGDMPVYLTFDIDCLDPAFARAPVPRLSVG